MKKGSKKIKHPDPDKLLDKVSHAKEVSGRGILKIFFGACAGVGKTYSMLNDAHQRHKEGIDVLIGVVETHGRDETSKLLEELPLLPLKKINYRGMIMEEFDLDAAIGRMPALILIDELAHTNIPGSRHLKRWQDVEELLSKGIDVYTTLNVQHLESLNDLVTRITGIQVRETVPDTVFDQANHITLVDIPTDEILKRLKEGKVYLAEQAQRRASEHFFKKRNLIALRELALRRTAERVDAQMGIENASQGIQDVMLSEKLLVCVGHDNLSTRIIRHVKRLSTRMKVPWHAIYIETNRHYHLNEEARRSAQRNMQLAEKMGATTQVVKGDDAVDEILAYAYANGITCVLLGRRKRWINNLLLGTLADKLIRASNNLEISVITDTSPRPPWRFFMPALWDNPSGYLYSTFVIGGCTLLAFALRNIADPLNILMFYLMGVVGVAAKFGTGPSILASLLGISIFNFFFIEPYHSFHVYELGYYFTFLVMLLTSTVIGSLASRLRLQASFYREQELEQRQLFDLTKVLSVTRGHEGMAAAAARHIGEVFNAVVTVWYPDDNDVLMILSETRVDDFRETSAAKWAFENGQEAGLGTDTLPGVKGFYLPLMVEGRVIGVIGVTPSEPELNEHATRLLEAFATILASALQRASAANEAEQTRFEVEGEKLRNMLLSSVSKNLRTPLTSISELSRTLLLSGMQFPSPVTEVLKAIHEKSSQLARLVTNLLDVSNLEWGQITLHRQPHHVQAVLDSAMTRLQDTLKNREIETQIHIENPIEIDGLLIEQVFINLLENAAQYAGQDAKIFIAIEEKETTVEITVSDNGRSIPNADIPHVFKKFYKGPEGGLGLGLPICKAIVEIHGGEIQAYNNESGGASFTFTLPKY